MSVMNLVMSEKILNMKLTDKQKLLSKQIHELSSINQDFLNSIFLKNQKYKTNPFCKKLSIFDIETSVRKFWNEVISKNRNNVYSDMLSKQYYILEVMFNKLQNDIRDFCIWLLENDLQYYFASDSLDVEYLTNLIKLYYISCCANIIITK